MKCQKCKKKCEELYIRQQFTTSVLGRFKEKKRCHPPCYEFQKLKEALKEQPREEIIYLD